jgi:hypothetical protein
MEFVGDRSRSFRRQPKRNVERCSVHRSVSFICRTVAVTLISSLVVMRFHLFTFQFPIPPHIPRLAVAALPVLVSLHPPRSACRGLWGDRACGRSCGGSAEIVADRLIEGVTAIPGEKYARILLAIPPILGVRPNFKFIQT